MKVGDYIRTKDGIIGKIKQKTFMGYSDWIIDTLYYNNDEIIDGWTCGIKKYDVIKSSPNIIDLIEVGDYVNGKNIDEIDIHRKKLYSYERDDYYIYDERDIKSIVTKEQFESMKYEVE